MEWHIEILKDPELIMVTTSGQFSLDAQHRMFQELGRVPGLQRGVPVLFDNRHIDMAGASPDIMRSAVETVQSFIRTHKVERLAGLVNAGVNFGMGRQFELLTEVAGGHGFRLFKDATLAIDWLTS